VPHHPILVFLANVTPLRASHNELERFRPDSVSTVPFCPGSPSDGSPNFSGTGTRAGVELAGVT